MRGGLWLRAYPFAVCLAGSRKYAARTLEAKTMVLVTVALADKKITVNCENVVFASNLIKDLKSAL